MSDGNWVIRGHVPIDGPGTQVKIVQRFKMEVELLL